MQFLPSFLFLLFMAGPSLAQQSPLCPVCQQKKTIEENLSWGKLVQVETFTVTAEDSLILSEVKWFYDEMGIGHLHYDSLQAQAYRGIHGRGYRQYQCPRGHRFRRLMGDLSLPPCPAGDYYTPTTVEIMRSY